MYLLDHRTVLFKLNVATSVDISPSEDPIHIATNLALMAAARLLATTCHRRLVQWNGQLVCVSY